MTCEPEQAHKGCRQAKEAAKPGGLHLFCPVLVHLLVRWRIRHNWYDTRHNNLAIPG